MLKNMGPFLFLLILTSCGERPSIRPGITSKTELLEMKGEPLKTRNVPAGEVFTYRNNEAIQLSENKVTAIFRDPSGDERQVLYWRHLFKDCQTSEKAINDEPMPEIELSCGSLGKSVVFVKGTGQVVRVGEYESR